MSGSGAAMCRSSYLVTDGTISVMCKKSFRVSVAYCRNVYIFNLSIKNKKHAIMENVTLTLTTEEAKVLERLLFVGPEKGKYRCYNNILGKVSAELEKANNELAWLK
jgi:hypothetical protein